MKVPAKVPAGMPVVMLKALGSGNLIQKAGASRCRKFPVVSVQRIGSCSVIVMAKVVASGTTICGRGAA